jgi:hypothetical protein
MAGNAWSRAEALTKNCISYDKFSIHVATMADSGHFSAGAARRGAARAFVRVSVSAATTLPAGPRREARRR